MATITAPVAWTDTEIREAVDEALHRKPPVGLAALDELSDAWGSLSGALDQLFDVEELRPSEQRELDELAHDALDKIEARALRDATEALAQAARLFAERHPDAPRAYPLPDRPSNVIDLKGRA